MSLASLGVLVMVLVGALLMAIGISLMTNFRGSTKWWVESVAESRGAPPERVFGGFSERSMRLVVGGAAVVIGSIFFVTAIIHV
jgi:hypothetical protein